jgi:polyphenol oxidase
VFAYQDTLGRVEVAFTDRHGGISGGPFASLNLAEADPEDRDAIAENLRRVTRALAGHGAAPSLLRISQVHGSDVHVVTRLPDPGPHVADALVTGLDGVILMVRVADCVPIVLADVEAAIVGVAHAGRPGMAAGIVPSTVAAMRRLGGTDLVAWIGPHVCGRCYEVPENMRAEISTVVPESYAQTSWGTPALDIGAGVRAQLERDGVEVVDASSCTMEDENLYSYRRQGKESGRQAGLVWVRP